MANPLAPPAPRHHSPPGSLSPTNAVLPLRLHSSGAVGSLTRRGRARRRSGGRRGAAASYQSWTDGTPSSVHASMMSVLNRLSTDTVFIDPGSSLAERLDQVVQRPAARRVPQRSALRLPARGQGPSRGLAHRLQHQQAAQRARLAHPGRVRRGLAPPTTAHTRIAGGSTIGIPSDDKRHGTREEGLAGTRNMLQPAIPSPQAHSSGPARGCLVLVGSSTSQQRVCEPPFCRCQPRTRGSGHWSKGSEARSGEGNDVGPSACSRCAKGRAPVRRSGPLGCTEIYGQVRMGAELLSSQSGKTLS